jgi:small subunit ribosomal protein S14
MAKISHINKDLRRRALINRLYTKRKDLKTAFLKASTFNEKFSFHSKLQRLPRDSSKTRLKNRCLVTGRSRGFYRSFGLSRHNLREMAQQGFLPGIVKSSW